MRFILIAVLGKNGIILIVFLASLYEIIFLLKLLAVSEIHSMAISVLGCSSRSFGLAVGRRPVNQFLPPALELVHHNTMIVHIHLNSLSP
jgi:hypothetical protein